MAGPDPPLAHPGRRAAPDGAGGQPARRHLQPGDLREGDPRLARLRRADRAARPGRLARPRHLPGHRDPGRPGGGGHPALGLRRPRRRRRLRLPGGRSGPRVRQRPHDRAGAGVLGAGRPAQRDDQDPGDGGVPARDRAGDLRGHQRQRHAAVRRRGVHDGLRGVHQGPGAPPRRRLRPRRALGRVVLRLARGLRGRQAPGGARPHRPAGPGRGRQRPCRLHALRGDLPRASASPSCWRPAPTCSARYGRRRV